MVYKRLVGFLFYELYHRLGVVSTTGDEELLSGASFFDVALEARVSGI